VAAPLFSQADDVVAAAVGFVMGGLGLGAHVFGSCSAGLQLPSLLFSAARLAKLLPALEWI